jgi:hypothetical protein
MNQLLLLRTCITNNLASNHVYLILLVIIAKVTVFTSSRVGWIIALHVKKLLVEILLA